MNRDLWTPKGKKLEGGKVEEKKGNIMPRKVRGVLTDYNKYLVGGLGDSGKDTWDVQVKGSLRFGVMLECWGRSNSETINGSRS